MHESQAVMKDFIGSHGKIAGLITSTLRLFQRDVHTILGRSSDISRLDGEAEESLAMIAVISESPVIIIIIPGYAASRI